MGVKQNLRALTEEARQRVEDNNGGRYSLDDVRAELHRILEANPEILEQHYDDLVTMLVRESDERATQASQMSLLEGDSSIWALGSGERVRSDIATLRDLRIRAAERKANVANVIASDERLTVEENALIPFFVTAETTLSQARSAYHAAIDAAA